MDSALGSATSVLDAIMGNLLLSLASVMSHISCTLDNSCNVPFDESENTIMSRELFCGQLQDMLALLSRHRSPGAVDSDYYLLSDTWVELLRPYESFIKSLLRRHVSFDRDDDFYIENDRVSAVDLDSTTNRTRFVSSL